MRHPDLTPSLASQIASIARATKARAITADSGTAVFHGDDGTDTIIGGSTGQAIPWVGDTTPPPIPSSPVCDSSLGILYVTWDGTFASGAAQPDDFAFVTVLVGGVAEAHLTRRGTVAITDQTAGSTVQVTLTASDDAHDEDGALARNTSDPTAAVQVEIAAPVTASQVQDAVTAADGKTTIIRVDHAPTADDATTHSLHAGDIAWEYADASFTPPAQSQWRWDGSAWSRDTIADGFLASLSTSKLLFDQAIGSEQIVNTLISKTLKSATINGGFITVTPDEAALPTVNIGSAGGSPDGTDGSDTYGVFLHTPNSDATGSAQLVVTPTGGQLSFYGADGSQRFFVDSSGNMRIWNPNTSAVIDLAPVIFGPAYYIVSNLISKTGPDGISGWFYIANDNAFTTPTGRIQIAFGFGNTNSDENGYANYVDGAVFFTTSTHGDTISLDNQVGAVSPYIRSQNTSFGLQWAQAVQIVSGLPVNTPIYPCWAFRSMIVQGPHSFQVRDRTIVITSV